MRRYATARRPTWCGVLLFLLAFVALADIPAPSPPLAIPDDSFAPIDVREHADILIDTAHRWSTEEILSGAAADGFVPATTMPSHLGFTGANVWLRFRVQYGQARMHAPPVLVLPKPLTDHVALYAAAPDGVAIETGDEHPFASRPLPWRGFAFPLAAHGIDEVTYYLRVNGTTSAIAVPLSLYSAREFRAFAIADGHVIGAVYGFLGGLLLCALLLTVFARQGEFVYFCLYLTAFALMLASINGTGMQYLWPDTPELQRLMPTVGCAAAIICGVLFLRRFIDLPRLLPWSEQVNRASIAVAATGALLHVFHVSPWGTMVVVGISIVLCPLNLVFCSRAALGGARMAGFVLAGWGAFVVSVLTLALDSSALISSAAWTPYAMYIGTLAQFAALAVGLADHLWQIQRSRARALAAANAELADLNANLEMMVRERTVELEQRNRELSELAVRDSLTGLYNHSTSIELLEQLLQQSQRYVFPVATIMIDLDEFKLLNDTWGHQVGDQALEALSRTLTESVRGADVVGRYGGEEFLIAMPHADVQAAREFGERLLARIRAIDLGAVRLTASIGIAVFHPPGHRDSAKEVIRRADEALYRSKRDGRDRVTVDALSVVRKDDAGRRP